MKRFLNGSLYFTIIAIFVINSGSVLGYSFHQNLQWPFYDAQNSCSAGVNTALDGNDATEQGFRFFVRQGLSAEQSAGLIGNFLWESTMVPTKNNGGELSDFPQSSSKAYGIAQWLGGRQKNLVERANSKGVIAGDLALQLDYVIYELENTEKSAANDLNSQTSVSGAALSVYKNYERAGNDGTGDDRVRLAQQTFDRYGSSIGSDVATSPTGICTPSVGSGQDTRFIEGFAVYSQYDPAWASKPYGSSTIATSGCGPSAMAMIITALTGQAVTPDVTAAYAGGLGLYVPGEGSSWSIAPILAEHWGLKSTAIGADAAKITTTLQSGGLVITSGQGPLPFTSGGHYIVIRGVTTDGRWKVGDSGHSDTSDKSWDPQQLLASMNGGSVYAITR